MLDDSAKFVNGGEAELVALAVVRERELATVAIEIDLERVPAGEVEVSTVDDFHHRIALAFAAHGWIDG